MKTDQKKVINPLVQRVENLRGVGPTTHKALAKAKIYTVFDLLLTLPKAIVPEHECEGIRFMREGYTYVIKADVLATKVSGFGAKKRLESIVHDKTGRLSVVFFGPAVNYAEPLLKAGNKVVLRGEVKSFLHRMQMVHPRISQDIAQDIRAGNQITYPQIAGLPSPSVKKLIEGALNHVGQSWEQDHLHPDLLRQYGLTPLIEALSMLHSAKAPITLKTRQECPSFKRLAFEEILSFYLRLFLSRQTDRSMPAYPVTHTASVKEIASQILPFPMTNAQTRVLDEIFSDLSAQKPMSRLLQGDVGSGKTAVSAAAAFYMIKKGDAQVAVMAPTEILAEQLFTVYEKFFKDHSIVIELLTSSTKQKRRNEITKQLQDGTIQGIVGTHALISSDVIFKKLGLVIIDEQHRFGVKQRAEILESYAERSGITPHLLVMSATPIPRSLALTLYGDLDISIIDERPPGRLPIHTQMINAPITASLEKLCERIIKTAQKAFIVFPLVEESEHLDLENATKAFKNLQAKFGDERFGLLHGRMKPPEKIDAMLAFKNGQVSFLVSTTVVEVGVDIPDATCMIIAHAERFGIAQLHQLRGRVGRGTLKSYCFLLTDSDNSVGSSMKRLNALCQTEDGFLLAQTDLDIRGAGDLSGLKQSGLPDFQIFNHQDFAVLIEPAKKYAQKIIANNDQDKCHHLFIGKEAHFS